MKTDSLLKNSKNQPGFMERRQKKDWVLRSVSIIAMIGWCCAFVAWEFLDRAKPETENFFSRLFGYSVRSSWDTTLLRIGVGGLVVSFLTCVTGFFVNRSRHRRKTDRYNKPIMILGVATFIMFIIFIKK